MSERENFASIMAEAQQAYEQGNFDRAFKTLRPVLATTDSLDGVQRQQAFKLFAAISQDLMGSEFAELITQVATNPDDPDGLIESGDAMQEAGLLDIASAVYLRANQLVPDQTIILERLSGVLEDRGRYGQVAEILRQSPTALVSSDFCRYLLVFHTLLSGNLGEATRLYPDLVQENKDQDLTDAIKRLGDMLSRAATIRAVNPLDEHDLRGWHYVITGGILLHESPHGREEMNGRYASLQDSARMQHESLQRLVTLLRAWQIEISLVLIMPDRESAALGYAAGQVLECPVQEWSAADQSNVNQPCLIVAYDLELSREAFRSVHKHRPSQLLWNYASDWTKYTDFAGDITTYFYAVQATPWQAGPWVSDPETKELTRSEEVTGTPAELAAKILAESVSDADLADLPALDQLAQVTKGQAAAFQTEGRRLSQWLGGPVRSNAFNLPL